MTVLEVRLHVRNVYVGLLHGLHQRAQLFSQEVLGLLCSATVVQLFLQVWIPLGHDLAGGSSDSIHHALGVDHLVLQGVDQVVFADVASQLGVGRSAPLRQDWLAGDAVTAVADVRVCGIVCADVASGGLDLSWAKRNYFFKIAANNYTVKALTFKLFAPLVEATFKLFGISIKRTCRFVPLWVLDAQVDRVNNRSATFCFFGPTAF